MYLSTRTQRGLFAGVRTGTLAGVPCCGLDHLLPRSYH
jgi:hypothetical protein